MRNVGLLGAGAIGMALIQAFRAGSVPNHRLAAVLARPHQSAEVARAVPTDTLLTDNEEAFLAVDLDIVLEAAGHAGARSCGPKALAAGRDFYLLSIGVLADPATDRAFRQAAAAGGAKIILPSGGMSGFDGLRAMAQTGLKEVTYTSTKPPRAWDNTPGEAIIRTRGLSEIVSIFEGNAREAALQFPKNANLAAAMAIAGLGFEQTSVRLLSDPGSEQNVGMVVARGDAAVMTVTVAGDPLDDNPKSSFITAASVLAALANTASAMCYA
jgi:aspartate dehydrogenase